MTLLIISTSAIYYQK